MTVIARFGLPANEFALRDTFEAVPDARFEIERIVAHDETRVFPYVWVIGDQFEAVDEALRGDPSVENLDMVTDLGTRRLYRMDWIENIKLVVQVLVEEQGTVLNARGEDSRWTLRIVFPDRDALDRTDSFCAEHDLTMDLLNVHELDDQIHGRFGLTEEQHEALALATRRGYYDVPRKTDMAALADELDISHQALSERLRRGQRKLNATALLLDVDAPDEA